MRTLHDHRRQRTWLVLAERRSATAYPEAVNADRASQRQGAGQVLVPGSLSGWERLVRADMEALDDSNATG